MGFRNQFGYSGRVGPSGAPMRIHRVAVGPALLLLIRGGPRSPYESALARMQVFLFATYR